MKGTKYMGVVKSVEGDDADNPTKYYVDFREYWGKNSQVRSRQTDVGSRIGTDS